MGVFETQRSFPDGGQDVSAVLADVAADFRKREYEVRVEQSEGGLSASIAKGGKFQAVAGLRTALRLNVWRKDGRIRAKTSVGLFDLQALPTAITFLIAWPVALVQIWGLVKQAKLDEEVLVAFEKALTRAANKEGDADAPR